MRDEDFFWGGVDQGKLLAQRCDDCGTIRHPPGPMCAQCQSVKWTPEPLSGRGRIYAWLISKHPSHPDNNPRTVALIDLAEGIRLISNIIDGGPVEIGAPVELVFREVGGAMLPQFRLVMEGAK